MVLDSTARRTDGSPIGDVAYLARSEHRVPALVALAERPRSRSELCELTGVSSSTIRRTLGEFEARAWVRKEGYRYETTPLGGAVATWMDDLIERVELERRLRDVWHRLPDAVIDVTMAQGSAVTVTVADPDAPYRPVQRFESLLRTTDELRFCRPEVALMDPCFDLLYRQVTGGVDVALIDRPSCHAYFASTYPERGAALLERENFTIRSHDDLPAYGVGLLDDRVVISCYEPDSGAVQALIDTDVSAVREWAEETYASYDADARPADLEPVLG